jgi:signal transduction histidine kinase
MLPRQGAVDYRITVAGSVMIDADRDQLYRVLSNLVRNAAQVIEQSGKPGAIEVRAARHDTNTVIDVIDNGPGLPPKAREHLFQAFQGSSRRGGTGLGLAIAHELIVAHGGSIRLVEGTERGAHFRIEIPDRRIDV